MPPGLTSPFHVLVIFVVAVVVLGPEKIPHAARRLGAAASEARRWSERLSEELSDALSATTHADSVSLPPPLSPTLDTAYTQPMLPFPCEKEGDGPR